jgi:hypothetical protein
MFSITPAGNNPGFVLIFTYPNLAFPISLVSFIGQISIYLFWVFFPNGRLTPRWMGLIILLVVVTAFLNNFPSSVLPFSANWPAWLDLLLTLLPAGVTVLSQIYRYRHFSTQLQRQQTKWVVLGVTLAVGVLIVTSVMSSFLLSSVQQNPLGEATINYIFYVTFLLIPLSIGFSILRYRLYDIDVLINRTLVYGMLTVSLTLIYAGLVISLQEFVRLFTGQVSQSQITIVVSTLAIAALFHPLRRGLQIFIDRRFYRQKYDAVRTLARFSATLRNEVDLQQLSQDLVAVVEETMQPTQVSIWLRKDEQRRKPNMNA